MTSSKPRLGILALMLENYESLFPGFIDHQTKYVRQILNDLADEILGKEEHKT